MSKQKILIIRLSSIGDVVQCSGVPRNLKKKYPESEIHWLVRADNQELVQGNPYISRIIPFSRQDGITGWLRLSKALKKENYTHVYDAHNNIRSHIICWFLKPQHFVRRSKSRLDRLLLFVFKINSFGREFRAVNSYIEPLKIWDLENDHLGSELVLPEAAIAKVKSRIDPGNRKWVALAPSTAWRKKTWPAVYWKKLIKLILEKTSFKIVILAGPKDDFCRNLVIDPSRIISLQGRLSLLESAAAVTFCETLIAADTGLLHMAEALKKNVVAVLGPTPFGHPFRKSSIGLQTQLWCQPCSKDGSGPCVNFSYQKCMTSISPDQVFDSMIRVCGA